MESVERDGVLFRLDDGKLAKLGQHDAQLRHIDPAFPAAVHAFQGRTVDRILAAMPAESPNLVNQRAFYVAISRARDAARLVTGLTLLVVIARLGDLWSVTGGPDPRRGVGGRAHGNGNGRSCWPCSKPTGTG